MIITEKIFTEYECNKIINYAKTTSLDFKKIIDLNNSGQKILENNKMIGGKHTSYFIYEVLNTNETMWITNKLFDWFESKTNINLFRKKYENFPSHFAILQYKKGNSFEKHIDLAKGFEFRRWNLGLQLNNDYDGGDYICWDETNNEVLIPKETGTAILYHCKVPHEIKEITNGERWSLVLALPKEFIQKKESLI